MESVGIIGTGRMGRALAASLARAGCAVFLGSRDAPRAQQAAGEIGLAGVTAGSNEEAAGAGGIVILATPFRATGDLIHELGERLAGKVVVDITNPLGSAPPGISGAELHAPLLPDDATLVAAWKTNFWSLFDHPDKFGQPLDVLLCGEDHPSKQRVARLIEATGFRPVDCGGMEAARALDLMVPLLIQIDGNLGAAHSAAWRILP